MKRFIFFAILFCININKICSCEVDIVSEVKKVVNKENVQKFALPIIGLILPFINNSTQAESKSDSEYSKYLTGNDNQKSINTLITYISFQMIVENANFEVKNILPLISFFKGFYSLKRAYDLNCAIQLSSNTNPDLNLLKSQRIKSCLIGIFLSVISLKYLYNPARKLIFEFEKHV